MKKIIMVFIIFLVMFSACNKEVSVTDNKDIGGINEIDEINKDTDTTELNNVENDLNEVSW